jgi:hypothetical protein
MVEEKRTLLLNFLITPWGQAPRTRTLATNAHTGELSRKTIVST